MYAERYTEVIFSASRRPLMHALSKVPICTNVKRSCTMEAAYLSFPLRRTIASSERETVVQYRFFTANWLSLNYLSSGKNEKNEERNFRSTLAWRKIRTV